MLRYQECTVYKRHVLIFILNQEIKIESVQIQVMRIT